MFEPGFRRVVKRLEHILAKRKSAEEIRCALDEPADVLKQRPFVEGLSARERKIDHADGYLRPEIAIQGVSRTGSVSRVTPEHSAHSNGARPLWV
jgi:hypothetical protein